VEDLAIAGVRLRLSFADAAMRERILPALAHRSSSPAGTADVTFFITERSTPVPPEGDPGTRVAYFAPSRALSVYDTARRVGTFSVPDATLLPFYERAAPLRTLLHWALEPYGCRLAHAAAVATSAGGALLAGRGGSGKSTTALGCLRNGFRYAGDDYVGVTLDGDAARAHSLFCTAKVAESGEEEKTVLYLSDVAPSFPLRAVILPRVAGGVSRLRRASGAEALRALAPTTMFQLPGNGEALSSMAALARTLPAWSLELGDDRENIPGLVARAIEESR
jgi:hypothetical protein